MIIILLFEEAGNQSLEGDTWERVSAVRPSLTRQQPTCGDKFIMTRKRKTMLNPVIGTKAVNKIDLAVVQNQQSNR